MLIQRRRFLALAALLPCAAALAAEERRDTFQVAGLGRVIAISPTVRAGAPSGASLTVIRSVGDWRRYFLVRLAPDGPCAFVAYTDKLAHFLSQPDSPVIFEMAVPGKRSAGDPDDKLGAWSRGVHRIPVYAFFEKKDGRVVCEEDIFSATTLKPLHYHDRIRSERHARLVRALIELMPRLVQ